MQPKPLYRNHVVDLFLTKMQCSKKCGFTKEVWLLSQFWEATSKPLEFSEQEGCLCYSWWPLELLLLFYANKMIQSKSWPWKKGQLCDQRFGILGAVLSGQPPGRTGLETEFNHTGNDSIHCAYLMKPNKISGQKARVSFHGWPGSVHIHASSVAHS